MESVSRRVIVAIPLAVAAIAAIFLLPAAALALIFAVLALLGAWEWGRLCRLSRVGNSIYVALIGTAIAALALMPFGSSSSSYWALPGLLWWFAIALWVMGQAHREKPVALPQSLLLIAGVLTLTLAWLSLVSLQQMGGPGGFWLLILFALVWGSDSGAYFAGRRFGRRRLAPGVSPNKTWEGFAGGMLVGLVLAGFFYALGVQQGMALPGLAWLLPVAAMVIAFSVIGDLAESLLKRQAGAKDSGHLLPGHGGILDRTDALLAAAPVLAVALMRLQ